MIKFNKTYLDAFQRLKVTVHPKFPTFKGDPIPMDPWVATPGLMNSPSLLHGTPKSAYYNHIKSMLYLGAQIRTATIEESTGASNTKSKDNLTKSKRLKKCLKRNWIDLSKGSKKVFSKFTLKVRLLRKKQEEIEIDYFEEPVFYDSIEWNKNTKYILEISKITDTLNNQIWNKQK